VPKQLTATDRAINLATRGRVFGEIAAFDFRSAFGAADVNAPQLYPQNLYTRWGDPFTVLEYSELPPGLGGQCEGPMCNGQVMGGIPLGFRGQPYPVALPRAAYEAPPIDMVDMRKMAAIGAVSLAEPAGALMSPGEVVAGMSVGEKIALGVSAAAVVGAVAFLVTRKKKARG
jgi:hypothetical protein